MAGAYRVIGAEVSPYSVKVRSYFRYKGIPHEWILRGTVGQEEFSKYAKLPLIPVVVTPDDRGMQDSTPILEKLELEHPEPSIHTGDPTLDFVSALLEEFGDEWGNKWMFHYRWAREVDQDSAAGRLVGSMMPDLGEEQAGAMAQGIKDRMVKRVWFVGSSEQTAPQIEESFKEAVGQLEAHLSGRSYLFGARPAFGDFGLWGQVYNAWTDPTPGGILRDEAPSVCAWVERMLEPKAEGGFERWEALEPTLLPLLDRQVGRLFLPWSDANARAIAAGDEEFSVELDGRTWTQKPQKYHARSLAALRKRYAEVADRSRLDPILEQAGCRAWLTG
jgi:glutathione S-transferase